MLSLPQLLEEDIQEMEAALGELITRSEASLCLVIDVGGFLLAHQGDMKSFDATTIGALASASFAATQAIASLVNDRNFDSIYQKGHTHSLLLEQVDGHCLLVVIFKVETSVGVVKYYSTKTITRLAAQMKTARERAPESRLDLAEFNLADPSPLFRKQG